VAYLLAGHCEHPEAAASAYRPAEHTEQEVERVDPVEAA
jgi:hypothetical protein